MNRRTPPSHYNPSPMFGLRRSWPRFSGFAALAASRGRPVPDGAYLEPGGETANGDVWYVMRDKEGNVIG